MARVTTFMRCKTETTTEWKNYSTSFTTNDSIDTVDTCTNAEIPLPSRSDFRTDERPRRRSSYSWFQHWHCKRNGEDLKRHSSLLKSLKLKSKYSSWSELESEEQCQSPHKQLSLRGKGIYLRTDHKSLIDHHEKRIYHCERDAPILCSVNEWFREALNHWVYHLAQKWSHYND